MNDVCIVAADGARARIFALDERDDGTGALVRSLAEVEELLHTGSADHRLAEEMDRRFAGVVIAAAIRHVAARGARRVLLVADAQTLAHLRAHAGRIPRETQVAEWPRHLTQLDAADLLAYLERAGALSGAAR
ncbi:MAG TPA: host attachment protein [Kofleriaceae bacterium]|jgi:hypothetical protein|nr:host attachment protein [Kofleriaceae bacterium]